LPTLVLLRHGESIWNLENRFTGWTDVDLSERGVIEAKEAGRLLKAEKFAVDVAFTSTLKRAIRTLWLALEAMDDCWVPIHNAWQLNERHYGSLQGLNKKEMVDKFGAEQVHKWRRGYDIAPPALTSDDARSAAHDRRYAHIGVPAPLTESLKDTVARVVPYWEHRVTPELQQGKQVLIAAHGNSLRALVKHLDGISDDEIAELNIPTGIPLRYELDVNMRPTAKRYLGDPEKAKAAAAAVANQTGKK